MKSAPPVAPLARVLALLQLASPALPVGGYAYSQGLETAVSEGRVQDAESVRRWVSDMLTLVIARIEAPLWLRVHVAALTHDDAAVAHWNRELLATRETAELRAESLQMGASMLRLYPALGLAAFAGKRDVNDPKVQLEYIQHELETSESAAAKRLRAATTIAGLEQETGVRIISSNQALCWHALRLAGCDDVLPQWGELFRRRPEPGSSQ